MRISKLQKKRNRNILEEIAEKRKRKSKTKTKRK